MGFLDSYTGAYRDTGRWLANLAGKTIDTVGGAFGNPLPELNISEWLQGKPVQAAEPPVPPDRIPNTSYTDDWQPQVTPPNTNTDTSSGGVITGGTPGTTSPDQVNTDQGYDAAQQEANRLMEQQRSEIGGAYDRYLSLLDQMLNQGLPSQRSAQEGIVTGQYQQGMSDLGLQKTQGLEALGVQENKTISNQDKNLKNLADNVRNMLQAGNIYLGSRGAGDSSAGDMFSYALNKQQTKVRGDVMNQTSEILGEIRRRETDLMRIVENEERRLATEKNTKINEIANWFSNAQQQIQTAKAQGQLNKATDLSSISRTLLDRALGALNTIEQTIANRRAALDQWAINNANNISQVKSNLSKVAAFSPTLPTAGRVGGNINVDAQGNMVVPGANWSEEEEERRV